MKKWLLAIITGSISCLAADAQTFTETRDIVCGDTSLVGSLGYPTWNPPNIVDLPSYGHAMLLGDFIEPNLLQYIAPPFFEGADTLVIECAHATQITCDTGIYVYNITCPVVYDPVFTTLLDCNDSVYVNNLSGWWAPQIQDQAGHGQARIILEPTDGAGLAYRPDPGFEGLDAVTVSLMGGTQTYLYLFQVYCNLSTGSREPSTIALDVFPNPVVDQLYIRHPGNINKWWLTDVHGRQYPVMIERLDELYLLDMSQLPAGAYRLATHTDRGAVASTIVVKIRN